MRAEQAEHRPGRPRTRRRRRGSRARSPWSSGSRSISSANVEFSTTPKPAPNSAIPASTAAGEASQIIAARPRAAAAIGRDEQPRVAVAVAVAAGLPAADGGGDRLDQQGGRGDAARHLPGEREERVDHARRDRADGEDQRQPERAAADRPPGRRLPASPGGRRAASAGPPAGSGRRWRQRPRPPSPGGGRPARPRPAARRSRGRRRRCRAGPGPRRGVRAGAAARSAPPAATPQRPKPRPRTKLTASMIARGSRGSSASVGAPSSSAPAASATR